MGSFEIELDIDQLLNDVIRLNAEKLADIDAIMQSTCTAVATLTIVG
jgi:hypothetical protein